MCKNNIDRTNNIFQDIIKSTQYQNYFKEINPIKYDKKYRNVRNNLFDINDIDNF